MTNSKNKQATRSGTEELIPRHGGYRNLKSFQVAQLVYDVTARFCDRFIDKRSRTHDQMVQAARSGVQNIAEGSVASGTSKKFELKLTNVARASLEELKLDYEDFLRQRGLKLWARNDPRRSKLIALRPGSVDDVVRWARDVGRGGRDGQDGRDRRDERDGPYGQDGRISRNKSISSIQSIESTQPNNPSQPNYPEIAANGALALIDVASSLLRRQIASLEKSFVEEGGFTERLYRVRTASRKGLGNKKR